MKAHLRERKKAIWRLHSVLSSDDLQSFCSSIANLVIGVEPANSLFDDELFFPENKSLADEIRLLITEPESNYEVAGDLVSGGEKGRRPIVVPVEKLKLVQKSILRAIPAREVHPAAYAYVPGRSAVECAEFHLGMTWGLKIDFKDFFSQVRESNLRDLFLSWGATPEAATHLVTLLTHKPQHFAPDVEGFLPQGAPTSGALANLVCESLDEDLMGLAARRGFTYTRYSDDIFFSTKSKQCDKEEVIEFLKLVRAHVNEFGMPLNRKKTRIYSPNTSHQYLGLLIGHETLRLPRHYRRTLEKTAFLLGRIGLAATEGRFRLPDRTLRPHWAKTNYAPNLLTRFVGQLAYVNQFDAELARSYAAVVSLAIAAEPRTWISEFDEPTRTAISKTLRAIFEIKNRPWQSLTPPDEEYF